MNPTQAAGSVLALAALALLMLQPSYPRHVSPSTAVVTTDPESATQAARLADSLGADLRDSDRLVGVTKLYVVGSGLEPWTLSTLGPTQVVSRAGRPRSGILSYRAPLRVRVGERVQVEGDAQPNALVRLRAEGESADSVQADSSGAFRVSLRTRLPGMLRVVLGAGRQVDTIGIDVLPPPHLRVVMDRASPDFDGSRLRDWLGRAGAAVRDHVPVTRGRATTTIVGGARDDAPDLGDADLIVMDATSLRGLSSSRTARLARSVRDSGASLLLLPDPSLRGRPIQGMPLPVTDGRGGRNGTPVLDGVSRVPPVSLGPYAIPESDVIVTLVGDGTTAFAAWRPFGRGRIGASVAQNTSRWQRMGRQDVYDAYWGQIVGGLTRPVEAWNIRGASPAVVNEPIEILTEDSVTVLAPGGNRTVLRAHPEGVGYWPRETGVHRFARKGDTLAVLVHGVDSWQSLRAARRADATDLYATLQARDTSDGGDVALREERVPWPRLPIFLLLLAGAGMAWRQT